MKQIFTLIIFVFSTFFPSIVVAQETATPSATPEIQAAEEDSFDYKKALADYKFTFELYKQADNEYQLARAQYMNSKTLTAQNKARTATYNFLRVRDDVVRTYLSALRQKIVEAKGLEDVTKQGLLTRLDTDIAWYLDHKEKIPSAGNLDDLVRDSQKARQHNEETTQSLIYRALLALPNAKLNTYYERIENIVEELQAKIAEIRQNRDKDTQTIERWILETQNKIARSHDKNDEIQAQIANIEERDNKITAYSTYIDRYDEALQYLKEANVYLKEIIKKIKYID